MDRIAVLFGGKSGEHEISLMSAAAVINSIDKSKHRVIMIGIDYEGIWWRFAENIKPANDEEWAKLTEEIAANRWMHLGTPFDVDTLPGVADFVLPILHGTLGEDGTIQGLLETLDIPYGGCGVLASALCMDKAMTKDILVRNNIPTCRYKLVKARDIEKNVRACAMDVLGEFKGTVFVKPANAGSSLGISKAQGTEELEKALMLAASFDRRVLVEEAIAALEVETSVMGNDYPEAASVGRIKPGADFYDYEAKYTDSSGTELIIPADISDEQAEEIKELAKKAYLACDCSGFARVDFFIEKETGRILLNEINTIPGFTKYSMITLLWQDAGVEFREFLERVIEFGYERHNDKDRRQTVRRR